MVRKLLIANRGEIAVRIARTAAESRIATVAIFPEDDANALHTRKCDEAYRIDGVGAAAYLDGDQIIRLARRVGCDAIHPGYGFLSEKASFAEDCERQGIAFIGPSAAALRMFGDKAAARALAAEHAIPILRGTNAGINLAEARAFLTSLGGDGAIVLKAVAGGGGRGMRIVRNEGDLAAAMERCRSEALSAFGNGDLYAEEFFELARHIEVQIVGDGSGAVSHIWDRECSLQRQRQKLVEIAPALQLPDSIRRKLFIAAVTLARAVQYKNLGTIEFLVDPNSGRFVFIEANPRLQVEHPVTEEITDLDLVRIQLDIASGRSLEELGLTQNAIPAPRGMALEMRVNLEIMGSDGSAKPTGGTLSVYEPPSGPGVRVDGSGYSGYRTSVRYDSLLAKLIVRGSSGDFTDMTAKAYRALCEFRIAGAQTNIEFLQNLLHHPAVVSGAFHTRFIDEQVVGLLSQDTASHQRLFFEPQRTASFAGTRVDSADPLAVLEVGKDANRPTQTFVDTDVPDGFIALRAPLQGSVVSTAFAPGAVVRKGDTVLILEAMKMEHVVESTVNGILKDLIVAPGDTVFDDSILALVEERALDATGETAVEGAHDLDLIRPDLAQLLERRRLREDSARPEAIAKRRKTNQRTARENIEDLCDPGSFTEFGSLVIAGRLRRNTLSELAERTPADGLVSGIGRVNGDLFPDDRARVVAMSYDYTVFAGTQGIRNHQKKDRMFDLAERWRLPVVFFTEGGGGRPGDSDGMGVAGLKLPTFTMYAKLSGLVPLVGIASGRCFAGNAVLLGCCDVIIATENATLGMGGPALIEGGGLGVYHPDEIGPVSVQAPNGVIDIVARDEADAVRVAKRYLSYFQGPTPKWSCGDQRALRQAIPENRLRVYDVRSVIENLADIDSVLELRRSFGHGIVTAFARIEGKPVGIVANNPKHLGGAIDRDASDKAARFMQLCEAYDIPIVVLCDTPGNMVGPEAEKTAIIRHNCRLFVIGANLTVPVLTVVLRKSYGLGAMGMAGSSFSTPMFVVSWPTGEFGGMGLEGAIKLGSRQELAAIADPVARKARYDELVAQAYARGRALTAASLFEFDEVIDPAETRQWIVAGLRALPLQTKREGKKLRWIDTW